MMNFFKIFKAHLLFCVVVFFMACSSDNGTPTPTPTPEVSSINPTNGPKTTIVEINGSDFGTDESVVTVFFNEVEALVQSVANDKITAIVPARAFSGSVTVVIDGPTFTGPEFAYIVTDVQVSTLAGSTQGDADGPGADAQFTFPRGVAVGDSFLFVSDGNDRIRILLENGDTAAFAGSTGGFADGMGANAQFDIPVGVAVDAQLNVYVADAGNHKIRKITPSGVVSTLAGSTEGFADGIGADAQFRFPGGVAVDAVGNVYVADQLNDRIRKIAPNGVVNTLAGSTEGFADGIGADAQFNNPFAVAVDAQFNVYVTDRLNHKIRKITQE